MIDGGPQAGGVGRARRHLLGFFALLLAMAGTAYGGAKLGSGDIADGAIGPKQIANNAVTSPKIRNGTVGTADVVNGSVGTGNLAGVDLLQRRLITMHSSDAERFLARSEGGEIKMQGSCFTPPGFPTVLKLLVGFGPDGIQLADQPHGGSPEYWALGHDEFQEIASAGGLGPHTTSAWFTALAPGGGALSGQVSATVSDDGGACRFRVQVEG